MHKNIEAELVRTINVSVHTNQLWINVSIIVTFTIIVALVLQRVLINPLKKLEKNISQQNNRKSRTLSKIQIAKGTVKQAKARGKGSFDQNTYMRERHATKYTGSDTLKKANGVQHIVNAEERLAIRKQQEKDKIKSMNEIQVLQEKFDSYFKSNQKEVGLLGTEKIVHQEHVESWKNPFDREYNLGWIIMDSDSDDMREKDVDEKLRKTVSFVPDYFDSSDDVHEVNEDKIGTNIRRSTLTQSFSDKNALPRLKSKFA